MSSVTSVSPRTLGDVIPGGLVRSIALVIGGAIFVGLTAQVSIPLPFTPVPLTLQTFSVLLVGAALGSLRGSASMALYLLVGVAGVPWFANHQSGWNLASFGYIVGFVGAAWLVGRLAERGADRRVLPTIGMMALGNLVIYVFGVAGLMLIAKHVARQGGSTWGPAIPHWRCHQDPAGSWAAARHLEAGQFPQRVLER
jgi:biotin transport system substrate-specific component